MFTATASKTKTAAKTAQTMLGTVDWVSDTEGEHALVKASGQFFTFWADDTKAGVMPRKGDFVMFTRAGDKMMPLAVNVSVMRVKVVETEVESMARAEAWVARQEQMEAERE